MSRKDGRTQSLYQRPSRAVPALIVALLMLAGSAGLVWAALSKAINGFWPPFLAPLRSWILDAHWDSLVIWLAGAVFAALGMLLILCAAVPGAFSVLKLQATDHANDKNAAKNDGKGSDQFVITRRGVANVARSQSERIDGVAKAVASASVTNVHVAITTPLRTPGDLRQEVVESVHARLERSGVDPVPKVTASVQSKP